MRFISVDQWHSLRGHGTGDEVPYWVQDGWFTIGDLRASSLDQLITMFKEPVMLGRFKYYRRVPRRDDDLRWLFPLGCPEESMAPRMTYQECRVEGQWEALGTGSAFQIFYGATIQKAFTRWANYTRDQLTREVLEDLDQLAKLKF
jgi:hypothetical protein